MGKYDTLYTLTAAGMMKLAVGEGVSRRVRDLALSGFGSGAEATGMEAAKFAPPGFAPALRHTAAPGFVAAPEGVANVQGQLRDAYRGAYGKFKGMVDRGAVPAGAGAPPGVGPLATARPGSIPQTVENAPRQVRGAMTQAYNRFREMTGGRAPADTGYAPQAGMSGREMAELAARGQAGRAPEAGGEGPSAAIGRGAVQVGRWAKGLPGQGTGLLRRAAATAQEAERRLGERVRAAGRKATELGGRTVTGARDVVEQYGPGPIGLGIQGELSGERPVVGAGARLDPRSAPNLEAARRRAVLFGEKGGKPFTAEYPGGQVQYDPATRQLK